MDDRRHAEEEKVVSEAQRQLKELLCRQMDTSTYTLQRLAVSVVCWYSLSHDCHVCRTLQAADSMFTAPVTYQPLEEGVAPLRSMQSFCSDQEVLGRYNELRGAGLSEREVQLAVLGDKPEGVMVEPHAILTRRKAIQDVSPSVGGVFGGCLVCVPCRSYQCMLQGWKKMLAAVGFWG